jgi:hypothetical protein
MVRAILAGQKTQTRRVVKPQPVKLNPNEQGTVHLGPVVEGDWAWPYPGRVGACISCKPNGPDNWAENCPYGKPGDRLWVKEAYAERTDVSWREEPAKARQYCKYRADNLNANTDEMNWHRWGAWKSPRFMPKCLSRITLEVTAVRVERLCDISEADAFAEGVESRFCARCDESGVEDGGPCPDCAGEGRFLCYSVFRELWESINGKGSWTANPWVWVVEFKQLHGPELSAARGDEGVGK